MVPSFVHYGEHRLLLVTAPVAMAFGMSQQVQVLETIVWGSQSITADPF